MFTLYFNSVLSVLLWGASLLFMAIQKFYLKREKRELDKVRISGSYGWRDRNHGPRFPCTPRCLMAVSGKMEVSSQAQVFTMGLILHWHVDHCKEVTKYILDIDNQMQKLSKTS